MNKILNRFALPCLVVCAALPVVAQTKTPATKMAPNNMAAAKMNTKTPATTMSGSKMSSSKTAGSKMSGGKASSPMQAQRLAWYKKTYGAQWKHHYNPKA